MSGGFRSRSKVAAQRKSAQQHSAQQQQPAQRHTDTVKNTQVKHDDKASSRHHQQHAHRRRGQAIEDAARETALAVIRAVRADGAYANIALSQELRHRHLNKQDAAFATELANGTVRAQGILDPVIEEAAHRPVSEIDGDLLDILRLGTYQLLRTRVPQHAAVSTSTELARAERGQGSTGFVNAVLRTICLLYTSDAADE